MSELVLKPEILPPVEEVNVTQDEPIEIDQPSGYENDNDEYGEDTSKVFEILHNSVDGLQDKFDAFYDNPTIEQFNEFDVLIKEFIALTRDLKNLTKSLLPKTEKPKRTTTPPAKPTVMEPIVEEPSVVPTNIKSKGKRAKSLETQAVSVPQTPKAEPKKRGKK